MGCGTGLFLAVARRRGWKPFGIDDCAEATRHAREHFGLDVWDGEFADFASGDRRFDAITGWDIIEHTRAPVALLQAFHGCLAPGGVVGLSTPNQRSILDVVAGALYRLSRGRIQAPLEKFYIEQHFLYFTEETLAQALGRAGLAVVESRRELTDLRRLALSPPTRLVLRSLFGAARATGLENRLFVVARARLPLGSTRRLPADTLRGLEHSPEPKRSSCWHAPSSSFPPTTRRRTCCRSRARSWRSTPASTCWWSTTPARTAPETWSSASALHEPRLSLLRRAGKLGLGTAYLAGFRWALDRGYGRVLTMDCDGSHDPRYIPAMLAALGHSDMVVGSRYVPGGGILNWPWHRRALSAFANFYARVLLRLPVHDCTSGFRLYTRKVLETVDPFAIRSSGYSFLEEITWRVARFGFRIGEVPIVFEQRTLGISKIDSSEIYLAAWRVLALAFRPPPTRRRPPNASGVRRHNAAAPARTMSGSGRRICAWSRAWARSSTSISPSSRTSSFCNCTRRCGRRSRAGRSPRSA